MNWFKYSVNIIPFYEEGEMDDAITIDRYDMMDQADQAFDDSMIRKSRDEQYSQMAIEDGKVIGAIASGWQTDNELKTAIFTFSVAVSPKFRGKGMVGLKLIKAAIQQYQRDKNDYEEMGYYPYMRLWVINPKLVPYLEQRLGFEIESQYSDGSAHLVMNKL